MIDLFHRGGPAPCYRPALRLRKSVALNDERNFPAANVELLNGATPRRGDPLICGACGQPLIPQWLAPRC